MPFIRGRYHINAIAGEALEAAREAEAALLASEHDAEEADGADSEGEDEDDAAGAKKGPIHRVEIEAAELVPAHSGRAQRGFVAHVHREGTAPSRSQSHGGPDYVGGAAGAGGGRGMAAQPGAANGFGSVRAPRPGQLPSGGYAARPETHVFSDHRDLVNFLRDEFAKQCKG